MRISDWSSDVCSTDRCDSFRVRTLPSFPELTLDPYQAADRPNPRRFRDRPRGRVGRNAMVRGAARLSAAAWPGLVGSLRHADLSPVGALPLWGSPCRLCAGGVRHGGAMEQE